MRQEDCQGVAATRSTNEAGEPTQRDPVEGKGSLMMEPLRGNTTDAQKFEDVSTKQQRIAKLARERPVMAFTSLAHLIPLAGHAVLEVLVGAPPPGSNVYLGQLQCVAEALSASAAADCPPLEPSGSEAVLRGTGCGKSARPDLWGAWVGDHPGLPGP